MVVGALDRFRVGALILCSLPHTDIDHAPPSGFHFFTSSLARAFFGALTPLRPCETKSPVPGPQTAVNVLTSWNVPDGISLTCLSVPASCPGQDRLFTPTRCSWNGQDTGCCRRSSGQVTCWCVNLFILIFVSPASPEQLFTCAHNCTLFPQLTRALDRCRSFISFSVLGLSGLQWPTLVPVFPGFLVHLLLMSPIVSLTPGFTVSSRHLRVLPLHGSTPVSK